MRTAGVDLSAVRERTAAVEIVWDVDTAKIEEPVVGLDDEELVARLGVAQWVGICAPFGWPRPMVTALTEYAENGHWPDVGKDSFRYRRTELILHAAILVETGAKLWPLSVSSDPVAMRACRLARLRERAFAESGVRFARSGADRVVEVNPAAALLMWGLRGDGYKRSRIASRREGETRVREEMLTALETAAPWIKWKGSARAICTESDDALDAVLAGLTARAAALGLTASADLENLEDAEAEGWIHLPNKDSLPLLLTSQLSLVGSRQ